MMGSGLCVSANEATMITRTFEEPTALFWIDHGFGCFWHLQWRFKHHYTITAHNREGNFGPRATPLFMRVRANPRSLI
jgi:hypothetical protein